MAGLSEIDTTAKLKNVIQETKDYDIFKKLPGNRPVSKTLVRDLIRSYTDKPQLAVARPILVNEYFQVVDGQHRRDALMNLGRAIPYMVVPKLTIQDARLLNALQRSWVLADYAYSYAETNGGVYQYFIDLIEEYKMPPRILLSYTVGTDQGSAKFSHGFKLGHYEPRSPADTQAWLDHLTEFEPYIKQWNEQSFALAVLRLLQREYYDQDRMIRKLETYGGKLTHRSGALDYLRDLETIYNANTPGGRYVRFV